MRFATSLMIGTWIGHVSVLTFTDNDFYISLGVSLGATMTWIASIFDGKKFRSDDR